jgi:hypothetical protein
MAKFIIKWDCGYGEEFDEIEAESLEEAEQYVYEVWRDASESSASYGAEEWTREAAIELGLLDEEE